VSVVDPVFYRRPGFASSVPRDTGLDKSGLEYHNIIMYDNKMPSGPRPIGVQIRALRKARGWSLAELAVRIGSSAPTIHRYESGWDRFELPTLRKIASALGATLDVRFVSGGATGGEPARPSRARLLEILSPLFWDRDLQVSDLDRYRDWILARVLVFGNWRQVVAVRRFYGDDAILRATERRDVDDTTRVFWNTILKGETVASEGS